MTAKRYLDFMDGLQQVNYLGQVVICPREGWLCLDDEGTLTWFENEPDWGWENWYNEPDDKGEEVVIMWDFPRQFSFSPENTLVSV